MVDCLSKPCLEIQLTWDSAVVLLGLDFPPHLSSASSKVGYTLANAVSKDNHLSVYNLSFSNI